MASRNSYFMHNAREAKRLTDKVDATAWVSRYIGSTLNDATRVLDVGCGPGVLAASVATSYPGLKVYGVDLSGDRFEKAKQLPANLELWVGDACSIPFPDNTFDLVYCRFLLEYLPQREQAIQEMVRVCRAGGRVMLQDLDGQLVWHYPEDFEFQQTLETVMIGLARTGFDPFVGRKLFSLVKASGLACIDVSAESYHLYAGVVDDHNYRLWETKLDIAMPAAAKILGSESSALLLKSRFLNYLRRDDTLTYSVLFTVFGTKSYHETEDVK